MSKFATILSRLRRLEPELEEVEPWPPTEDGSLAKVLYDQLRAEGMVMQEEHSGDVVLYLLEMGASWVWKDYDVPA